MQEFYTLILSPVITKLTDVNTYQFGSFPGYGCYKTLYGCVDGYKGSTAVSLDIILSNEWQQKLGLTDIHLHVMYWLKRARIELFNRRKGKTFYFDIGYTKTGWSRKFDLHDNPYKFILFVENLVEMPVSDIECCSYIETVQIECMCFDYKKVKTISNEHLQIIEYYKKIFG